MSASNPILPLGGDAQIPALEDLVVKIEFYPFVIHNGKIAN